MGLIWIGWSLFLWPLAAGADVTPPPPVRIGVATALYTVEGQESLKAATMAVEEVNAQGGVPIGGRRHSLRLVPVDLKDAAGGVRVEDSLKLLDEFLRTQAVHGIVVGPFRSEVLLPAMDLIAAYRVPLIGSIAMSSAMEAKVMKDSRYRYVFRTGLNTRYLTDYLIESMRFLHQKFGFTKIHILSQDVAWARSTASLMVKLYFERSPWQITGMDHYPSDATDFSTGLTTAASRGAQVILPIFDAPGSGQLVTQWNAMKIPALLCGFVSPMMGPGAWSRFGGHIAGALNITFELGNIPSTRYPPATAFYRAFAQRFGHEIEAGHGPAPTYEAVHILTQAIEKTGTLEADGIVAALESTDRAGVMGRLRFHRGHQVIFGKDPAQEAVACLFQWSETGKRVIVYPPILAEGDIHLPDSIRVSSPHAHHP